MANTDVTSAPLFGSASKRDVEAIQKRMNAFTEKLLQDAKSAREILRKTGATNEQVAD